jgi:hypothetical protein
LLSLAAYGAAWYAASRLSLPLGRYLQARLGWASPTALAPVLPPAWAHAAQPVVAQAVTDLAYVLLFLGVLAGASALVRLIEHMPLGLLRWPNRLGGALFGGLRNALLVALAWALAAPYALAAGGGVTHAVERSRLLAQLGHLVAHLPALGHLLFTGVRLG